jgi:mRNA interferase HigB
MRIIARPILRKFWTKHPDAEQPLKSWHDEAIRAKWKTPNEIKRLYLSASIISDKRVVFNIKGNSYRLVADVEYRLGIVFIVWMGTHKEYDKIDVKTIHYDKTD